MNSSFKQNLPLLFLIVISIWWAFYYQSNSFLNDFGNANFEWLFLIDGLIVLPILCWFCIADKKEAVLKIVVYSSLVVFIGSFIIPATSKLIWPYLESGRYIALLALVLIEVTAIITVSMAIHAALKGDTDPDIAISSPVKRFLGENLISQVMCFEARVWSYVLFAKLIKPDSFTGNMHFTYHKKDDAQINSMGFIFLILFEAPLMHLVLHFVWSPEAANIVTGLTLIGLAFMFAENRAMSRRPISVDDDKIIIRCGVFNAREVALANVKSIGEINDSIPRSKIVKEYDFSGYPNIVINLVEPDGYIEQICLGVDDPKTFMAVVNDARSDLNL